MADVTMRDAPMMPEHAAWYRRPMQPLRVLSLWQPWATLAVLPDPKREGAPGKEYETRSWYPSVPPPFRVAIHATKGLRLRALPVWTEPQLLQWAERCSVLARELPQGAIVGVATVTRVWPTERTVPLVGAQERAFGDFSPGRYAWRLAEAAMLLHPIPLTGRQSALWCLPAEVEDDLWTRLRSEVARG